MTQEKLELTHEEYQQIVSYMQKAMKRDELQMIARYARKSAIPHPVIFIPVPPCFCRSTDTPQSKRKKRRNRHRFND